VEKRFGRLEGTIRDASTLQPIAGATVQSAPGVPLAGTAPTGANGQFQSADLGLSPNNAPLQMAVSAQAAGHLPRQVAGTIEADTSTRVTVDLLRQCAGATITGQVVNAATHQPIVNAQVKAGLASETEVRTDKNGLFTLSNLVVGPNNAPAQTVVSVTADGFY